MAFRRVLFSKLVPLCAAGYLLLLHSPQADAAASWVCAKRLPSGDCLGPTTLDEDGEVTTGIRALIGPDDIVWAGKVTHWNRQRVRTECSYAPTGRCDGQLVTVYPDGKRRIDSVRVRDGADEYEGISIAVDPDGRRLDCRVNVDGDCEGEAVLLRASRELLHGTRKVRDGESTWTGYGRWFFPNGLIKDCWLAEDATCRPGPITFWDRDSKTVGTLGANGMLAGPITIYDKAGLKKSCVRAVAGGCRRADLVVTRVPPGAWERPRPKKATAARPPVIRAAWTPTAIVMINPGPDSAEIRYQFLACGDDVRLAYTLIRASRQKLFFKGQVWKQDQLIGAFADPATTRLPMGTLTCTSAQTRSVTSLKSHQQDLLQHTFVDGSEAWTMEERVRHFLDQLSVRTFPVVEAPIAAPRPIAVRN